MKTVRVKEKKKTESTFWEKPKKDVITKGKNPNPNKIIWNKPPKNKITKGKNPNPTTTIRNKPPKEKKIVKKKIDKEPTTTRNKPPKEKMTNKNKDLQSLQDIINRIENGEMSTECKDIVEKFTPRTDKRDYKLVAYQSRGLDPEWDAYRFCEVTMELEGRKVNADEIHHIFGRENSNYNNPEGLIFVCRKEHDRIHQYETKWLKDIVKKYLIT